MSNRPHVRVGLDLISVEEVSDSVVRFGNRYLDRVYTSHELASCVGTPPVVAAGLAARFAAKEATLKVLRALTQPDWRSIEVRRDAGGWCSISLTGQAAALAEKAGINELTVSLTHDAAVAAAVVVAVFYDPNATDEPGTQLGSQPEVESDDGREDPQYSGWVRALSRRSGYHR
jgi:holo-[acyl-carrier protein] synthase